MILYQARVHRIKIIHHPEGSDYPRFLLDVCYTIAYQSALGQSDFRFIGQHGPPTLEVDLATWAVEHEATKGVLTPYFLNLGCCIHSAYHEFSSVGYLMRPAIGCFDFFFFVRMGRRVIFRARLSPKMVLHNKAVIRTEFYSLAVENESGSQDIRSVLGLTSSEQAWNQDIMIGSSGQVILTTGQMEIEGVLVELFQSKLLNPLGFYPLR